MSYKDSNFLLYAMDRPVRVIKNCSSVHFVPVNTMTVMMVVK